MKFLFKMFRRKRPQPITLSKLVGVIPSEREWRMSPETVASTAHILSQPHVRSMIAVLEAERPGRFAVPHGTQPTDVIRAYDFNRGYEFAIAKLLSLGESWPQENDPEPTFKEELYD